MNGNDEFADAVYGIAVPKSAPVAKTVSIVRRYTCRSVGEIRSCITSGVPLLVADEIDLEGLEGILELYEELVDAGIEAYILEDGKPSSVGLLRNWIETMKDMEDNEYPD